MARLLTNLLFAFLAAFAGAQSFGCFGYSAPASAPGLLLSQGGFRVDAKDTKLFGYARPTTEWRVSEISDVRVTATVSTAGLAPRKIHINLLTPGVFLYFESGFSFTVRSEECPYLTWDDGSVGPDVPTPSAHWIAVSFRDSEPPILLSFPSGNCSVRVGGESGSWTIRSVDVSPIWVRVVAPLGGDSIATKSAADLGGLVRRVTPNLDLWTGPEPNLKSFDVKADETSVTGTWHFDQPGVSIPLAALFAADGGYGAEIQSASRDSGVVSSNGPVVACTGKDLEVRFPARKLPEGQALALNAQPLRSEQPASLSDISRIVSVALCNLVSSCDPKTRELPTVLLNRFIAEAADVPEPFTGQQLPYQADGVGLDVASAIALLQSASLTTTAQTESQPNAMLLSLLLRRDWSTWLLTAHDEDTERRATALAAIAATLGGDSLLRLQGAMLEAGLASQRGLNLWRSHHGLEPKRTFLEPMDDLRSGLFYSAPSHEENPFVDMLCGPLQVLASFPTGARSDPHTTAIIWFGTDTYPKDLTLCAATTIQVVPGKNVLSLSAHKTSAGLVVRALPSDEGPTEIWISTPNPPTPVSYAGPPPYSEIRR